MIKVTKANLLIAYREYLRSSGRRPTEILLCTLESGSISQWDIKNSKDLLRQAKCIDESFGQPGDYLTFDVGTDPFLAI